MIAQNKIQLTKTLKPDAGTPWAKAVVPATSTLAQATKAARSLGGEPWHFPVNGPVSWKIWHKKSRSVAYFATAKTASAVCIAAGLDPRDCLTHRM